MHSNALLAVRSFLHTPQMLATPASRRFLYPCHSPRRQAVQKDPRPDSISSRTPPRVLPPPGRGTPQSHCRPSAACPYHPPLQHRRNIGTGAPTRCDVGPRHRQRDFPAATTPPQNPPCFQRPSAPCRHQQTPACLQYPPAVRRRRHTAAQQRRRPAAAHPRVRKAVANTRSRAVRLQTQQQRYCSNASLLWTYPSSDFTRSNRCHDEPYSSVPQLKQTPALSDNDGPFR